MRSSAIYFPSQIHLSQPNNHFNKTPHKQTKKQQQPPKKNINAWIKKKISMLIDDLRYCLFQKMRITAHTIAAVYTGFFKIAFYLL
jgi:hypothetical protein